MVSFNATLHQYAEDGVVLPSVTQMLRAVGIINAAWHTPAHAAFDQQVHEATAQLDRNGSAPRHFACPLPVRTTQPRYQPIATRATPGFSILS